MDTITYQDIPQPDGSITVVAIIDHGDGSFTSMTKATYEATLAANSAPQA